MSEREEGGDGDPTGEPAGEGRRRRLTLAPRPRVGCDRDSRAAKVCCAFAGTQESGGGLVAEETSPETGTCSDGGRSSVASSSSMKEGFERLTNGSRFWVLTEDSDSNSESCVDGAVLNGAHSDILAVPNPLADAERRGPPAALGAPRFASPGAVSVGGARARRPVHPKSTRGDSSAGRPWQGPLPPARVSPARSLGVLWVMDRQSGAKGGCWRLAEMLTDDVGRRPPAVQPETTMAMSGIQDPNSNSVRPVAVLVGLNGSISWMVVGSNWVGKWFRGMQRLGLLFRRGGGRFASSSPSRALYSGRPRVSGDASTLPRESNVLQTVHLAWGSGAPHLRGLPATRAAMASRP
jgi:hypothetical protein